MKYTIECYTEDYVNWTAKITPEERERLLGVDADRTQRYYYTATEKSKAAAVQKVKEWVEDRVQMKKLKEMSFHNIEVDVDVC